MREDKRLELFLLAHGRALGADLADEANRSRFVHQQFSWGQIGLPPFIAMAR
jgi:hypothetical protein